MTPERILERRQEKWARRDALRGRLFFASRRRNGHGTLLSKGFTYEKPKSEETPLTKKQKAKLKRLARAR